MPFIQPEIRSFPGKVLVGIHQDMSVADNQTLSLWRRFMGRRHEIENQVSDELYSLQLYPTGYFQRFDPTAVFTKWAALEVSTTENIPGNMHVFDLASGLYAVFHYKGMPGNPEIFQYIYGEWLQGSGYMLDQRPHFEILGRHYKPDHPDSEEEIWIPIRK